MWSLDRVGYWFAVNRSVADLLAPDLMRDRPVFVTGGGSGINLGIAHAFASVGAPLAICGRTQERLDTAAAELAEHGGRVVTAVADVRDAGAVDAALVTAEAELGPAHTVVCGAAGNFVAPVESLSTNGFSTVVEIDLLGAFHAAKAGFDQLRRTAGSVVFVSAGQSRQPYLYQAHVGAAKAGIDSLMRSVALEWARHGVRANSIVPGPIRGTEGMERLSAAASEETWNRMVPMGRFGETNEVAAMAVVLASPLAAFVTGTEVVVDGGLALTGSGMFNQVVEEAVSKS